MIKGFVFDLDGVLTDTAEYHYLAWKELAEGIGIHIDRKFNENLKGIGRMDSLERILAYGNKEKEFTEEEKNVLAAKKNDHYRSLIQSITEKDLLPGIPRFLKELKGAGMSLALASASKNGPIIIEKLGIADEFDTIVDPAGLKKGKPDPEIFLTGAEQLGLAPQECVGIEDAESGVEAIKGAGMFAVGIGDHDILSKADVVYASTKELFYSAIIKLSNQR